MAGEFKVGEIFTEITLKGLEKTKAGLKGLKSEIKETSKSSVNMVNGFTHVGAAMGVITAASFQLIKAASDSEETFAKFGTVFKEVSKEAEAAANNLDQNFGVSSTAARKLLGDTGDLLTGFGFASDKALELSNNVAELAVDLASFTNFAGGAEGAAMALTKAMFGETEMAKSLGIVIKTDTKEYKDLIKSIMETENVSATQAKAFAALKIATSQSKNAIGDFARTEDQLANQTRILLADFHDLQVELGREMTPAALEFVKGLKTMLPQMSQLKEPMRDMARGFLAVAEGGLFFAEAVGPIIGAMTKLQDAMAGPLSYLLSGIDTVSNMVGLGGFMGVSSSKNFGLGSAAEGGGSAEGDRLRAEARARAAMERKKLLEMKRGAVTSA
jgi:hypothetical protein